MDSDAPLLNDTQPSQDGGIRAWIRSRSRDALSLLTLLLLLGIALGIWVYGTLPTSDQDEHPHEYALSTSRIYHHLEQLMEIAQQHNNSRSVQQGHADSAEYVISHLKAHGNCDIQRQYFRSPVWKINRDPVLEIAGPVKVDPLYMTDYRVMRYGGQGQHRLKDTGVAVVSDEAACTAEKVGSKVSGKVAIVFRHPGCTLFESAFGLEQQGAQAVVFVRASKYSSPSNARARITDWEEGDPLMRVPVLSATHSLGQLLTTEGVRMSLSTDTAIDIARTYNVLCVGRDGDPQQTVLVGAHLDSVAAGPGMNDNGSGAATVLEILLTLERLRYRPSNRLAFAWWAAEEDGLLGSRHFVRGDPLDVRLNLNFDMLASPNYISLVHNGTDAPPKVRKQSERIQQVFMDFFNRHKYPHQITDMRRGSDFLPFLESRVPAGGILAGAGELKSEEERKQHGGMASAQLDPCYHRKCDTLGNVNMEALGRMSKAAMHAISLLSGKLDLDSFLNK